ncbi:MAG: saccharopine dehydrogenase [Pseudomonadota bacterium]
MTHLWVRAEERANERRVGLMPDGVAELRAAGMRVTVEESAARAVAIDGYRRAGADIAPAGSWRAAPLAALIFGLKELPDDGTALPHRHILFGHAYKGQPAGQRLLSRFARGGGMLLDLEYLTDAAGRRLAAFGYWAGFAGAAVSLKCWAAQERGDLCGPVHVWDSQQALLEEGRAALGALGNTAPPEAIIIGAKGRVGSGAADYCRAMGLGTTLWDMEETAHGGPYPEVLDHAIFLNCILAQPGAPVFLPASAVEAKRRLRVVGDIACDPTSEFSPIKIYDRVTTWAAPALRVADDPILDVMAIDNLPSLLPAESSADFAAQLLPVLRDLPAYEAGDQGAWVRAEALFHRHAPKEAE